MRIKLVKIIWHKFGLNDKIKKKLKIKKLKTRLKIIVYDQLR
jgi:hypothetical protein